MKKTAKVLISAVVAITFVTAIMCCCMTKAAFAKAFSQSTCHACAQKTAKADSKTHDCCLVKASAAESIPVFAWTADTAKNFFAFTQVVFSPLKIHSKFNLAYLNGPPGSMSATPLYIQFHSLRV